MKHFLLSVATLAAVACAPKTSTDKVETQKPKTLVLYYSQMGATKTVALELQKQLGADIEAVEAVNAYDGDFQATVARGMAEREKGELPELKPLQSNIADYDVVFLGYPIWYGTFAQPMAALLNNVKFEGKKVVPFCTFGSGGLTESTKALKEALPQAQVMNGYGVRALRVAKAPAEIERFLKAEGYIEGEVEQLPEYSAQQPVTDAEKAIFDAACSDYQFPLGTPTTFGSRETSTSTDYLFSVESKGMDGAVSQTSIYVTVDKAEGSRPEFTVVVR